MLYVFRNRLKYGPYTEDELLKHVASGYFETSDMCWKKDMEEWAPIKHVISLPFKIDVPTPVSFTAVSLMAAVVLAICGFAPYFSYDLFWHHQMAGRIAQRKALVALDPKTAPAEVRAQLRQHDQAIIEAVKKKPLWSNLTKEEAEQIESAKNDLADASSK